jgi:hypothetical protein
VARTVGNYGINCGFPIYILYDNQSGVLVMDTSRKFILLFSSSSNVKFSFGVMLLKLENSSCMLVLLGLYAIRTSSTNQK